MVTNLTVLDGNTFFDSDPTGDVEPGEEQQVPIETGGRRERCDT
jgi:hypothetical protein